MRAKFNESEEYSVVSTGGKVFLFCDMRMDRNSFPENAYIYEVADGDGDGCFARIAKNILVNFWGTIFGPEPLELDADGKYYPNYGTEEYEGTYFEPMTWSEFVHADRTGYIVEREKPDTDMYFAPGNRYKLEFELRDVAVNTETIRATIAVILRDRYGVTNSELRIEGLSVFIDFTYTMNNIEPIENLELMLDDGANGFGINYRRF